MPPPLPSRDTFREKTKHPSTFSMRGKIGSIDEALREWEKGHSLETAIKVYRECSSWLYAKAAKVSDTTATRRTEISDVRWKSVMWIAHFDPKMAAAFQEFDRHKHGRGVHPEAKKMGGVYAYERQGYLDSKKTSAPSATILDGKAQELGGEGKLPSKFPDQFSQLTEDQFKWLDKKIKESHEVWYMKKLERLKYMLWVREGDLVDFDGNPAQTSGSAGWPYAMDRYGSLFTVNHATPHKQVNHSTLNAGKEVICAGMIKVEAGNLRIISNNSGHYKPAQKELYNAVQALVTDGLNLALAKVELWDYATTPGSVSIWEFPAANFPAAGKAGGTQVAAPRVLHSPGLRG